MEAKNRLNGWDFRLEANSIEAAIYVAWENQIRQLASREFIPEEGRGLITSIPMKKTIDWLLNPDSRFGSNPQKARDGFLTRAFINGVAYLQENLGNEMSNWQLRTRKVQTYLHGSCIRKCRGMKKNRSKLNIGPLPRGGNSYTPGSSGGNNRQSSGASFRMIVNTGDWDAAIATNGPGQSGNPESPFYRNLFEPWATDQYFPVYYSRNKIEQNLASKTTLKPNK